MLSNFSYEELSSDEATHLKASFRNFKQDLERKMFGEPHTVTLESEKGSKSPEPKVESGSTENMLIAKVSHEIRTPLNGIIGFTDLLKEDGLTFGQLEKVNAIQSASYALLDIINELLEYSKLSAGLEHFDHTNFNFHNVINEVVYLCKTLITDKDIKLELAIDSGIPQVLVGDPSKLSQILLNLLGNAIKFVDRGSIRLTVHKKRLTTDRLWLGFDVSDTGIGISEDQLAHIFDAFKQADDHTFLKYGGSGLGLSIVKQIIDNLGGDISVRSTLGVGTTFNFTLPYEIGETQKKESILPERPGKGTTEQLVRGMRILVFEDNVLNQRLIDQRLRSWGCTTFITENAQYGLNLLEKTAMDIVLMDLRMPGMNGFEVTQQIRKSKSLRVREIPVIAITADFSLQDKDACIEYGINDFILKPYSPEELLSKLIKNKKKNDTKVISTKNPTCSQNAKESPRKVDLAPILKECMGDVSLLKELIQLYEQNILEFIGSAKTCIKHGDFETLGLGAHKIKAGIAMMKSDELHDIVVNIQEACKIGGDLKHLQALYICFLEEYPKVEAAIDSAFQEIKRSADDS